MSVEQAREAFIEHLRREFGDDVADERADGIRRAREDSEDFIVGYLAAISTIRGESKP
jgi:hypothetical protein